jgi:23S rRNA (uracil1939-C5)-methyltransferase
MVQFYKSKKPSSGKSTPHAKLASNPLSIDVLDQHANGIALSTKPITIVPRTLPGEQVSVVRVKGSKKVQHAKLCSVEVASKIRQRPQCPYYEQCGGCAIQHASARDGLNLKLHALTRYIETQVNVVQSAWLAPILSQIDYDSLEGELGYRRRVKFAIDARNEQNVKIGYRKSQSNDVVDIERCAILSSSLRDKSAAVIAFLKQFNSVSRVGHLQLTQTHNGVVVDVYLSHSISASQLNALAKMSDECHVRLIVSLKQKVLLDLGIEYAELAIEDYNHVALALENNHFIQVNQHVNAKMIAQAIALLKPAHSQRVHDFFCGIGNFSLALAAGGAQVIGYEVEAKMVEQARINAQSNELENVEFNCADLSHPATLNNLDIRSTDLVLLDPARAGAQQLCEYFVKTPVQRILYVSCNSNTLIRDLKILQPRYKVKAIGALDMFPFTQHLESMVLLTVA